MEDLKEALDEKAVSGQPAIVEVEISPRFEATCREDSQANKCDRTSRTVYLGICAHPSTTANSTELDCKPAA